MYCIMSYDISSKNITKVFKLAKRYLHWIQNSVFEGELTATQIRELKEGIGNLIDPRIDSVVFYEMQNKFYLDKNYLGKDKSGLISNIIE